MLCLTYAYFPWWLFQKINFIQRGEISIRSEMRHGDGKLHLQRIVKKQSNKFEGTFQHR